MRNSPTTKNRALWILGAIILPVVLIGGLLGVTSDAETALERIPVALVNNDAMITEINDDGEEEIIFASRPLVTELVGSDDLVLDWVITSSEQASILLARGEVYAIFEIPENFSEAVQTLGTTSPKQASFTIRTDPSHSYLAGILADQLGATIASTISDAFSREITSGLYTVVVSLGDAFQEISDGANEVADGTETLAEGTTELVDGVRDLNTGTRDFANGYATFDDGLGDYLAGVRSLSDGLDTFESETRGLGELATGISEYTDGVAGVSSGLNTLNGLGVFAGIEDEAIQTQLQTLLGGLGFLASNGTALSAGAETALSGVREGIVGIDKGADALADASLDLESGSGEIREGTQELADGVSDLYGGVQELDEGVQELATGKREFADGVTEGAAELNEQGLVEPSDKSLDTLVSPVGFSQQEREAEIGLAATLASGFIPIGLWFVSLVYFLIQAPLSPRVLNGTAPHGTVVRRTLRPVLIASLGHPLVATALIHALGGVAWSSIFGTLPLIALGSATFMALHYLVWAWRPAWLGPISITAGVLQIVTLGSLVPREILPNIYQVVSGFTPMGWFVDALQGFLAGAEASRIGGPVAGLMVATLVALVVASVALRKARLAARLAGLGYEVSEANTPLVKLPASTEA